MKSMWEMKFLPQAMDTPLTVMMVPPWAGTPTAQLSWAGQYAAHMHAPYGRRHQQRVWTHLPWRRDLRWRGAHCLLGQQTKFKGLERFRSIKNKGHFCPWNTLDFTWDVCYSNRLRRSRTILAYSMQRNTETEMIFFQRLTGLWQITFLQWLTGQMVCGTGAGDKRLPVFLVSFKLFPSSC